MAEKLLSDNKKSENIIKGNKKSLNLKSII